ncbi:MAG: hypothetical protein K2G14_06390 [Ruminococcus sp.]|nr:hypothetical protein [Ruminococcus sp.]
MDIIKEKIKKLEKFVEADDLEYWEYQVCDFLETADNKEKYIPCILELMENNPLAEWGCPGEFVHFMESCNSDIYEKLLKESIKRCPTLHTLFMLNRLCNGKTTEEIPEYINILCNICENTSIHEIIRDTAEDFMNYQFEKISK